MIRIGDFILKCLFCTSESSPFALTGGLGDVSGSLPKALQRSGKVDCRVVMPLYKNIPSIFRENMEYVTDFNVSLSWRNQNCKLFKYVYEGVTYYFIDNLYYFNREGLYGYYDDAERFAFFSRAVLSMIDNMNVDFKPDIIHCNDWQTALIPVYINVEYRFKESFRGVKTIFTIHNLQYRGVYGKEILGDVLGISYDNLPILEFDGNVNFVKGAIETSNFLTTVSPTYANELRDPYLSFNLSNVIERHCGNFVGILNGIDNFIYNPATDDKIYHNYSVDNMDMKASNKKELAKRLNLDNYDLPMIGMVTRLTSHKGIDLVCDVFDRIMSETNAIFVVLGSGNEGYERFFREKMMNYRGRVSSCFGFVDELARKIYASSDIFLMPSEREPCGISQMIAMRYGSVPLVRSTGGLNDSVETGDESFNTGFSFWDYNSEALLMTLKYSLSKYEDKMYWNELKKRIMRVNNDWSVSAKNYIDLYNNAIKS